MDIISIGGYHWYWWKSLVWVDIRLCRYWNCLLAYDGFNWTNTFAVPRIPKKIPNNVIHRKCEEKMKVVSFVIGAAFKWLERSFWETMEREEIFQMAGFGVNQATEMGVVKKPKKSWLLLVTYFPGIIILLFANKGETFKPTIFLRYFMMKMMLKRVFDGQSDYEVFPDIQPSIVCSWRQKSFRAAIKPHHCGKGWGRDLLWFGGSLCAR